MNRTTSAAVAFAAVSVPIAVVVGTDAVQATPAAHSYTLHLTSKQLKSLQVGQSRMIETDKQFEHGKAVGFDVVDCTFNFSSGVANCSVAAALNGGLLYAHIKVNGQQGSGTGKVVGGTGAYKGARGTVTSTSPTPTTSKVTIVYHT